MFALCEILFFKYICRNIEFIMRTYWNLTFFKAIVLLLLVSACNSSKKEEVAGTVIKGNIKNAPDSFVYFKTYIDSVDLFLGMKSSLDSARIDGNGNFELHPKVDSVCVFTLVCGNRDLISNALLTENGHLDITFTGKDYSPVILSKNEISDYNTFLLKLIYEFYKKPDIKQEYYIASNYMDAMPYAEYNGKRMDAMLDFYTKNWGNRSSNQLYYDYAVYTMKYECAADRLMFLWKHRMKNLPIDPDSTYFNYTDKKFLNNPQAYISPSYIRFINLYLKDKYETLAVAGKSVPGAEKFAGVPPVQKYMLAASLFDRPVLNAVLTNLLLSDLKDVDNKDLSSAPSSKNLDSLEMNFKTKYKLN